MNDSRRLMVTGGSGFVGSSVVRLAREAGWPVRAVGRRMRAADGVEFMAGDISDLGFLREACEGITALVHAAGLAHLRGRGAREPGPFQAVNEIGTDNVVAAAVEAGVRDIVLVSSVSVYGNPGGTECEETTPCQPRSPYALSKWMGERRARERVTGTSANLTILRFATIFGEGDRGNVAELTKALMKGRFIWPSEGLNCKSMIYKDDAARACLRALEGGVPGVSIFNVSSPPATMRDIVAAICEALGRPVPKARIPKALLDLACGVLRCLGNPGGVKEQLQKVTRSDIYSASKFEAEFGLRPSVPLSNGIRREVCWMLTDSGMGNWQRHGAAEPSTTNSLPIGS